MPVRHRDIGTGLVDEDQQFETRIVLAIEACRSSAKYVGSTLSLHMAGQFIARLPAKRHQAPLSRCHNRDAPSGRRDVQGRLAQRLNQRLIGLNLCRAHIATL